MGGGAALPDPHPSQERVVMSVSGITKHFQAVRALQDVSIDFRAGTVHVLFGENGAGKSTLIGVLAGVHRPDRGTLTIDGSEVSPTSPRAALQLGVSAVFQEPALIPQLSIAENLSLGRERTSAGMVQRGRVKSDAVEALARIGSNLPPERLVRHLSRAERQIVEMARALQGSAKVLILDEPTASLTEEETNHLFDIVQRLRSEGLAIIYITHRMQEIRRIGDYVTVLRDGKHVRTCPLDDVTNDELITLMTGREVGAVFPAIAQQPGDIALELRGVSGHGVTNIDLVVRTGEVVGLTGLVGSGKGDVGRICFGLAQPSRGELLIHGIAAREHTPSHRLSQGMVFYPADRKKDGLIHVRPVRENASLAPIDQWTSRGFLRRKAESRDIKDVLRRLDLKPLSPEALPTTFSGGNQQKVVLARGFAGTYDIHVFDEPTAGVDVGARSEIYQAIQELAEAGSAVLVISSDLPEVVGLVHRAYVMAEGRIAGEFSGEQLTEAKLLPTFFDHQEASPS